LFALSLQKKRIFKKLIGSIDLIVTKRDAGRVLLRNLESIWRNNFAYSLQHFAKSRPASVNHDCYAIAEQCPLFSWQRNYKGAVSEDGSQDEP
jgi:hypothetical protein